MFVRFKTLITVDKSRIKSVILPQKKTNKQKRILTGRERNVDPSTAIITIRRIGMRLLLTPSGNYIQNSFPKENP